jgi:regulator of protease activity HflC (stomatin/prohibitin superfamily)
MAATGTSKTGLQYVTDEEERPVQPTPTRNGANTNLITVQPLKRGEMQPSYAQTFVVDDAEHGAYGSMINCLGSFAGTLGSIPCCFCCPNPYRSVQQGSVGLVSRFGQFYKSVDPGLVKVNPYSEKLRVVDVKIQIATIPRQNVMTKDNVAVDIDSVLVYHIVNPFKAAFGISDVRLALIERSQTTLRHVVGSRNLQSVLTDREAVAAEIETIVEGVSEKWGVSVESILIKDIVFSQDLQQSLSSAAQQKRIGESKVIAARAEVDSAKLMREAADILSSPAAIQIRQLEALQTMARTASAKVVFVPMNLFSGDQSGGGAFNQAAMLENLSNQR